MKRIIIKIAISLLCNDRVRRWATLRILRWLNADKLIQMLEKRREA